LQVKAAVATGIAHGGSMVQTVTEIWPTQMECNDL